MWETNFLGACILSVSRSLLSLSRCISLTVSRSLALALFSLFLLLSFALTRSHVISCSLALALSLSLALPLSHSLSVSLSVLFSHSLWLTPSFSLSVSLSCTDPEALREEGQVSVRWCKFWSASHPTAHRPSPQEEVNVQPWLPSRPTPPPPLPPPSPPLPVPGLSSRRPPVTPLYNEDTGLI